MKLSPIQYRSNQAHKKTKKKEGGFNLNEIKFLYEFLFRLRITYSKVN